MKTIIITVTAGLALFFNTTGFAETNKSTEKYHAVIIQGAGYLPNMKKPEEGTDAITHATTKEINTYTLTDILKTRLLALNFDVTVLSYTECKELKCLVDGSRRITDMIIFAGPSHFSKQPPQLTKLYKKLDQVVKKNPKLLCSTLVPAWYPDTKGKDTIKVAAKAFVKSGAGVVEGLSLLTPREKKNGASPEKINSEISNFAQRLFDAAKGSKAQ